MLPKAVGYNYLPHHFCANLGSRGNHLLITFYYNVAYVAIVYARFLFAIFSRVSGVTL